MNYKIRGLKTLAGLGYQVLRANVSKRRIPIFLSLNITNKCNLQCKYCYIRDDKLDKSILDAEYSKEEIFKIVDEFYEMGTRMIYILGGEPLIHKDIGKIIDYIVNKNIYLHITTNGTLIERKLDEIKNVHTLCVSLDGIEDHNDDLRGKGVFNQAIKGIKSAVNASIPCRVHAVLTRKNLHEIRTIVELCRDLKITFSISPPNFLGETEIPDLRISTDEYKVFWKEYLNMYHQGLPIGNSSEAIKQCLNWPVDYHRYIKADEKVGHYKPTFCLNGHLYAGLAADGTMCNCINLGVLNGPNIKKYGVKKAWEMLLQWRPDCVSCASINCIETAMLLNLRLGTVFNGLNFHRKFFHR
ncbi:MAG: radical SAM protein [Nitrospirae bacterium]|nr:radical SAM protein [Nitrospirota bacterium]